MLMVLDDVQSTLYDAMLKLERGKWFDRPQIAEALGKKQLSSTDKIALDLMAAAGRIEKESRIASNNVIKYVYRLPEEK